MELEPDGQQKMADELLILHVPAVRVRKGHQLRLLVPGPEHRVVEPLKHARLVALVADAIEARDIVLASPGNALRHCCDGRPMPHALEQARQPIPPCTRHCADDLRRQAARQSDRKTALDYPASVILGRAAQCVARRIFQLMIRACSRQSAGMRMVSKIWFGLGPARRSFFRFGYTAPELLLSAGGPYAGSRLSVGHGDADIARHGEVINSAGLGDDHLLVAIGDIKSH